MKNLKKYSSLSLFALPFLSQATEINLRPDTGLAGSLTGLTMPGIISALIQGALVVAAIVFFFILVIGGVQWIVSGGDKAQTEAARGRITAALIGLTIVFAAWAIGELINVFFGVNIFELQVPRAQ